MAYSYRWQFFTTCIGVMMKNRQEQVVNIAIGARVSKLEQKDFDKFVGTKQPSHEDIYKQHQAGTL